MLSDKESPIGADDTIQRITDLIFTCSQPRALDLLIVLGSPTPTACYPAIEMFRAGLVPWIVVTGRGRDGARPEWRILKDALLAGGVPEDRILFEPDAVNTLDNIKLSARLIAERLGWSGLRRIGLSCKPLHARRALLTAQTHLPPGLSLSVHCPTDPMDIQPGTWWQSQQGLTRVMGELRRIGEYTQKGDLRIVPARRGQQVHLLGIGGAGMSALARLYLDSGWAVTGSDHAAKDEIVTLAAKGVVILPDQSTAPEGTTLLVYSPAIPRNHPALIAARQWGIPVQSRSKALTELLAQRDVICVAGSHGKSTTTAMLAQILTAAGIPAGHMLGGLSDGLEGGSARLGEDPLLVAETCEAFRGLDHWTPAHCLVTNVDDEHSEHYATPAALHDAFADLVARVPEDGAVVLSGDDPSLAALVARMGERVLTFGIASDNRVHPADVVLDDTGSSFDLVADEVKLGRVLLTVPGVHNLRNALGALAMALALGIDPEAACLALTRFRPVQRRWQLLAAARGVRVFDDFAHHPTEIEATLALARQNAGSGRVFAVLEPQMISRVTRLAEDYATALALADVVWLLPLSAAGEPGDTAAAEAKLRTALGQMRPSFRDAETPEVAALAVCSAARAGDIVVCMGPEGARRTAYQIAARLAEQPACPTAPAPVAAVATGDQPRLLQHGFAAQVASQPNAACILSGDEIWSYARMEKRAGLIAGALTTRGIGRGDLVAVTMHKTPDFVAALLGIVMAGAAFVPVDPRMTRAGMGRILRRAGARLTLTDDTWHALQTGFDLPITIAALLDGVPSTPPELQDASPEDLAYGIFTSGSTGVPRLVGIEHRNVVSYFDQCLGKIFRAEDYRVVPASASISFDAIVHQVFCTLSLGGTILLVDDIASLAQSPHLSKVTLLGGTPSMLRAFLDQHDLPATVGTVNLGGEPTPPELLNRLRDFPALRRVWNIYGPAETTMVAFAGRFDEAEASVQAGRWIGYPFPMVRTRIVDAAGQTVPQGEAGELLIGGPTVGRGYLGVPEQTKERFFTDRHDSNLRWYRSGDVVRQLSNGSFHFLGRSDDQIKINGARVELGEVRAALMSCPGVADAAVLAVDRAGGRTQLVAFVVLDAMTDVAFLREWLRLRHAPILAPHRILAIDTLPVQVNGKIDRQTLVALAKSDAAMQSDPRMSDGTGDEVLAIWRNILGRHDLDAEDDFRAAGGDSLAAMEIIMAVETRFDTRLPPDAMDALTTPAAMLRAVSHQVAPAVQEGDLLHRQRMYVAGWSGRAARPDALVRTLNSDAAQALFWVFQGDAEFTALSGALGTGVALHGMRSGHQIMDYTPDTIERLAETYASEITKLLPEGQIHLGGNCQGAVIARAVAFALRRRGREVARLVLMEMAKPWAYDAPVDLVYGRQSVLNPFRKGDDAPAAFTAAYTQGFARHFIDGEHGAFFQPQNVGSLATVLRGILQPGEIK